MIDAHVKLASFSVVVGPHLAGALLLVLHAVVREPEPNPKSATASAPTVQSAAPAADVHGVQTPRSPKPARTLTMRLEAGEPVPEGRPNTWVHIPHERSVELSLTFVFHGFKNCIESYTSAGIQCTPTNIKRPGYQVASQLERAGSRSIVVIPETSFDIPSAEAPTLAKHGAFRAYVEELLSALESETGGARLADVKRLALVASSGGYQALEPILQDSSAMVTDVLLLDAGYMYPNSAVGRFLGQCATELAAGAPAHHAGILYTPSGGALPTTEELLRVTMRRLDGFGALDRGRFGRVRNDPSLEDLSGTLYVLRVNEEHDVVVRRNLGRVIAAAGL